MCKKIEVGPHFVKLATTVMWNMATNYINSQFWWQELWSGSFNRLTIPPPYLCCLIKTASSSIRCSSLAQAASFYHNWSALLQGRWLPSCFAFLLLIHLPFSWVSLFKSQPLSCCITTKEHQQAAMFKHSYSSTAPVTEDTHICHKAQTLSGQKGRPWVFCRTHRRSCIY